MGSMGYTTEMRNAQLDVKYWIPIAVRVGGGRGVYSNNEKCSFWTKVLYEQNLDL